MKKIIFVIALLFFTLISLPYLVRHLAYPGSNISKTGTGHMLSFFFQMNQFTVVTKNTTLRSKIKITWAGEDTKNEIVIFDEKLIGNIDSSYGANIFNIYYQKKKIKSFMQVKFNNWHYHHYIFNITKDANNLRILLKIIGPDTFHETL